MSLEYELKWNNFNTFTEDGERIIDMPPNKVLLQSSDEGVTGGYFDSAEVWHEFGSGGGEGVKNPTVTINLIGNTTNRYNIKTPQYSVENGLFTKTTIPFLTQHGASTQLESLAIKNNEEGSEHTVYEFNTYAEYGTSFIFVASDLVNCEFYPQEDGIPSALYVTDQTKNASITITVNNAS